MSKLSEVIPDNEIPVLLTIFNRPDKVKLVIDNLRKIKPKCIFIYADGPRPDVSKDVEKCHLAREKTLKGIDWACNLETNFLDENLGCDPAVSSAIEWFFQNVEYGIILEDDCIVSEQFFTFCGDLLERYADDERVMQISSLSPYVKREYPYDYHFSRMFRCSGGWATWQRTWRHYAHDMSNYSDTEILEILKAYFPNHVKCMQLYRKLMGFKEGENNYWDFLWNMACYAQNGLSIVPEKNLMLNIGFDEESTHTKEANPIFENVQIQHLKFPLRHPQYIYADSQPETSLEKKIYDSLSFKSRIMYLLRHASGCIHYLRDVIPKAQ